MREPERPLERPVLTARMRLAAWQFARSEDGALVWLTLILLVPMIMMGGFAVDLMRYESRRAAVQGVTDQAVLAAASLNQTLAPRDVIYDYFTKAGDVANLAGEPEIDLSNGSRMISADGYVDVPTFFFGRKIGIYQLAGPEFMQAGAASTAVEGLGATEVSLVLDISGSMMKDVPGTGKRRMQLLQEAASGFIDDLLPAEDDGSSGNSNTVSISLVPYSSQVNVGPEMFAQFTTDHRHDFSHCLEFPTAAFTSTTVNLSRTYEQTEPLQTNTFGQGGFTGASVNTRDWSNPDTDQPICPNSYQDRTLNPESITYFSQDADALKAQINALEPRGGTSIHLGLKWGAALLDPTMQPLVAALPDTVRDPAFADRPGAFEVSRNSGQASTLKYLILVTDGTNDSRRRLKPEFSDTASELNYFARHNLPYALNNLLNGVNNTAGQDLYTELRHSAADAVGWMRTMCDATKRRGIQIFTVSVSGDDTTQEAVDGRTEMRNCADDPSKAFTSSGANLDSIFTQIAKQITDLRLTQ